MCPGLASHPFSHYIPSFLVCPRARKQTRPQIRPDMTNHKHHTYVYTTYRTSFISERTAHTYISLPTRPYLTAVHSKTKTIRWKGKKKYQKFQPTLIDDEYPETERDSRKKEKEEKTQATCTLHTPYLPQNSKAALTSGGGYFLLFFHLAGSQPATIAKLLLKNLTYNINAKPLTLICVGGLFPKEEYLSG